MLIPFGIESYQHRSRPLSAQSLINCYLEKAPPDAKTIAAVVMSYGIDIFATGIDGVGRGSFVRNGVTYAVIGASLISIAANAAVTVLGAIGGSGPVEIVGDEINLMIVTNGGDYTYNGSAVSVIADPDYPGADWVAYLDGYYIVGSGGEFFISANRNPTSWNALDFASAEKKPDDIVDATVDHSELILYGRESGEIWYNSGDTDFPITKSQSGDFEVGIYCRGARAGLDNTDFFLGNDGIFYRLDGYTPVRKSHHAIEQAIEDADDKNFRCMTWKEGGHSFVSIGSTSFTFVFDIATELWYQRKTYGYEYWRINSLVRCYDEWLCFDSLSANIGKLNPATFMEFGGIMRSSATAPSIASENRKLRHSNIELVFEQGVGLSTGQGSDPQVMIRWSDDGGRTWSNEKWRSLGAIGEFKTRVKINRAGTARDRVYEYAITDPVPRTLILAMADVH